jgi:ParB/RepB/Spo0J family partition protein
MNKSSVDMPVINSSLLATRDELREHVKRSDATIRVLVDNIRVRQGFNLRMDFGDIDALADSILAEGLLSPITVDVLKDGTAVLNDGERRFRAINILRNRSTDLHKQFEYVECRMVDKESDEAGRIVSMLVHNSGKPFEPLEEAEGFRRLIVDHGLTATQVASRVGKSLPYVEQKLLLTTLDAEEKAQISSGKISSTAKIEQVRRQKDPEKRKAQVEASAAKGKKLKVKDVKQSPNVERLDRALQYLRLIDQELDKAIVKDKSFSPEVARNILYEVDTEIRSFKNDLK